jgi:hypothetical protein
LSLFPGAGFDANALFARRLRRSGLKELELCNRLAGKKAESAQVIFRGDCQCGGNFTGVRPPPRSPTVWKET